ncbi:hypothetical protein FRZ44_38320 [Hypericibacter terrae]|uniref:HTH cro/C1-type domain-containing protein n=1 Tax=Hypericibacter terrae TaxID=2602015 RepID=A0A5J6MPG7_9PROT|nr:YdaS family helix-turn-helix protein [Hypericibacter terrae]QEX18525.1 hypothetical protein FRZ44_38320 [Hypericibacter terrae]
MKEALQRAVEAAGGQAKLARALNELAPHKPAVSQALIWDWINRAERVATAERVLDIEKVTGVSRHELRPDLYPREEAAA